MTDLLLDPAIRSWVFVPIIVISFLTGIIRHYAYLLMFQKKKSDIAGVQDSHYLAKVRLLRENGRVLPPASFQMRKNYYAEEETGFLPKRLEKPTTQPNPLTDPSQMGEMMKGNMLNMVPMFVIGGWINWTFSGFVTTQVPFPLTLRFKPMLQRGVELLSLDAAWVSSASWYFLCVFGLRNIYNLVLGGSNVADAVMDEQAAGNFNPNAQGDAKAALKAEWEALQLYAHAHTFRP